MRMRLPGSLRLRILLLIALASIPGILMEVWTAESSRSRELEELESGSLRWARAIRAEEDEFIDSILQTLMGLSTLPSIQNQATPQCEAVFRRFLHDFRRYSEVGLIDDKGHLVCSGSPSQQTEFGNERFFRDALRGQDLSIGVYEAHTPSGPGLRFAYPVSCGGRQSRGVLFVTLDLRWLNETEAKRTFGLPSDSNYLEVDRKGVVLVSVGARRQLVGQSIAGIPLFALATSRESGTAQTSGLDGKPRFIAFASIGRTASPRDLTAIIEFPPKEGIGEINRTLRRNLTALVIVAGAVLLIGLAFGNRGVLKPVQALTCAMERLAGGQFTTRVRDFSSNSGELNRLAASLNSLGEALENHEMERLAAEQAL
ncbi:MAG: HAMP domain-containing protein, partial [Acidobacteriota bacterium]